MEGGKQTESASSVTSSASSKKEENADDAVSDIDPLAGPAVRRFHSSALLRYGYIIYNAHLERATRQQQLQTQLRLFYGDQKIFEGKLIPLKAGDMSDPRRIEASGALQLGSDMKPGSYVLQVIVTDPLAKEKYQTATQWIDFEVIK